MTQIVATAACIQKTLAASQKDGAPILAAWTQRGRSMKQGGLNVLVIDENRIRAAIVEEGLRDAGCDHVAIIDEMHGLARRIAELNPDVIVIDLENPNRDMLESIFQLSRAVKRPIAMFVYKSDEASIEPAVEAGVSAYIVDGLKLSYRVSPAQA